MAEFKHTPEPWHYNSATNVIWADTAEIEQYRGNDAVICFPKDMHVPYTEMQFNAERIVECVNACAGMADPEAYIQSARDAVVEGLRLIKEHRILQEEVHRLQEVAVLQDYWRKRAVEMENIIIERDLLKRMVEQLAASVTDEERHKLRLEAIDMLREIIC